MAELSIVNQAGAESIKKSLESLDRQSEYINQLTSRMAQKDSVMLNLVLNLKRSLADVNDEDVQVEVRGGVAPERLTAGGKSEYMPKDTNLSNVGRANNRRTEIVITPKLDQYFKLLETPGK